MRIGLQVIAFNWAGSPQNIGAKLGEIARAADDAGFYSMWVMDHFFQMQSFSDPHDPMLEGYTASAYMAAQTKRIKHGLMVTGGFYRYPGILIKTATTLDVLSGGRSYFGIGAGWYEREAQGLGVPFPPTGERMARLEEILQIAQHMWSGDESPYDGKYYQLAEPITRPQPLSQPHPPILIGGGGEKKTLRFVAQYGDACNLFAGPGNLDSVRHKLDVLQAALRRRRARLRRDREDDARLDHARYEQPAGHRLLRRTGGAGRQSGDLQHGCQRSRDHAGRALRQRRHPGSCEVVEGRSRKTIYRQDAKCAKRK